ncbi:MAG TPA: MBL fold metallo-hydrolase [Micropepsaceae bacterium]|jgi:glyoxylase-like metal-dependent hydrolase (beta-lactamase superfamily II)|nr:MBL fold metallo-hydrolase [Micropepsaceae bacterium]
MKYALGVAFVVLALGGPAVAQQDARTLLQAADRAVGASKVNSVQYTGTGRISFLGQNFTTTDDWPRVDLQTYTQTIDYGSKSAKEDYVRVQGNNPARGGGAGFPIQGAPRTQNFVSGNYAWTMNAQGQPQPQNDQAEARQFLIWVSPHGFIKAAMADQNATESDREFVGAGRTLHVVGFTTMGKYKATGEFNDRNELERVVTWIPSPVMGDMQVEIRYSDYRDVGNGIRAPFHIHMHQGDHPLVRGMNYMDVQASDVKVNIQNASLTVPDAVRNAPAAKVNVATTKLADGVWLLAGGTHNSLAVEFKDFAAIIEAPLDDARTNAVIAETKRLIPGKQIKYVVNTHHHWDHSGGLRAAAAEGATIVTNELNRNFYERVVLVPQPRTLSPDRLSMFPFATTGPGPGKLETYRDRQAITDGTQSIISYHVEGFNHAGDMAIVYLPQSKILVNADMYSPPAAGGNLADVNANAVALFNNIKRLKLDVARHVPIHGNPGPQADFDRIVGPVAARARPAAEGG